MDTEEMLKQQLKEEGDFATINIVNSLLAQSTADGVCLYPTTQQKVLNLNRTGEISESFNRD
jgi:hypothetical protein